LALIDVMLAPAVAAVGAEGARRALGWVHMFSKGREGVGSVGNVSGGRKVTSEGREGVGRLGCCRMPVRLLLGDLGSARQIAGATPPGVCD
jgi:hypothetical protein